MILIDTNVCSELINPHPARRPTTWLLNHYAEAHISSITVHELEYGVRILPEGARKTQLLSDITTFIGRMSSRTLAYDTAAAEAHARIRAEARANGRGLSSADGQILGIAKARGIPIATRNVKDFEGLGVEVLDPWAE